MFFRQILQSVYIYLLAGFILLALVTAYYFSRTAQTIELTINGEVFTAWVADTAHLREVGLGGKTHLSETQAMLFVGDPYGRITVTTAGMRFPIDILWLDKEKRVVYMLENVATDVKEMANPEANATSVLEMRAFNARRIGITIGDVVIW